VLAGTQAARRRKPSRRRTAGVRPIAARTSAARDAVELTQERHRIVPAEVVQEL
jgi:hypothetical protein